MTQNCNYQELEQVVKVELVKDAACDIDEPYFLTGITETPGTKTQGGETIDRDLISSVSIYVLLYIIITFVMAVVYAAFGIDLLTSVSASISMMSNVGPCFGTFGSSMSSFASAPELAKILMGVQMIIGRLGIYSILLVFILYRKRA